MSLTIGVVEFDRYEGTIVLPKRRVALFGSTHLDEFGAQLLPKVGAPFEITTTRHDAASDRFSLRDTFDAAKGTIQTLKADGITYANPPYAVKFLVQEVMHQRIDVLVHAAGSRGGVSYSYSPAGRIITKWTLVAVPAS